MGWQDAPVVDEAPPQQQQAWASAPEVAAEQPPAKQNRFAETAARIARGLMMGGPLGAVNAGVGEALRGLDDVGEAAGGATTDALAGVVPPQLAAAAGTALKVGIPAVVGGGAGAGGGSQLLEKGAKRLVQSALKPTSKSLANKNAAKAIQTLLEEGISVTAAGGAKLRELIGQLKGEVGRLIATSPAQVNRGHVYKELSKALDDVTEKGAGYNADRASVLKAWEEFKSHPLLEKFAEVDDMIPIQMADKVKRATQQSAKEAYRRPGGSVTPADEKSQMAIAAGLREGMEAAEPGIAGINAKLSRYINALHQLEPRAAIAANRDLGGLVPLAETPEMAMLMLADRNPWLKSYVAKVLYEGRKGIPAAAGIVGAQNSEQVFK